MSRPGSTFSARMGAGTMVVACAVALTACGTDGAAGDAAAQSFAGATSAGDLPALVAAAQEEGTLTFYEVPTESVIQEWVAPFEEEYGIDVQIYRGTASEVHQRFSQESDAGVNTADVVATSVPAYVDDYVARGLAAPYTPANAGSFPPEDIQGGTAYPLFATTATIAWNTEEVTPEIAQAITAGGYAALLDPALEGRVGIISPAAGGLQLAQNMAVAEDPNLGWPYFDRLDAAGAVVFDSSVPFVTNQLTTGEFAVGIGIPDPTATQAIQNGAPLQFVYPDGTPSSLFRFFAAADAPHPAAARLFLEWGTTLDAQTRLAELGGGLVLHEAWTDARTISKEPWYELPADGVNIAWERETTAADQQKFIQEWLQRVSP